MKAMKGRKALPPRLLMILLPSFAAKAMIAEAAATKAMKTTLLSPRRLLMMPLPIEAMKACKAH